jgi:LPS sulfotransferase NodH
MQTNSWRRDTGDGRPAEHHLEYSFDALDHLVRQFEEHEDEWRRFFGEHGVEPFEIAYEDVVADYRGSAVAIARYLGIEMPGDLTFGRRSMTKQADELSGEWMRRFRADAERAMAGRAEVGAGPPA